jgi:hypothetical protein
LIRAKTILKAIDDLESGPDLLMNKAEAAQEEPGPDSETLEDRSDISPDTDGSVEEDATDASDAAPDGPSGADFPHDHEAPSQSRVAPQL